MKHAFFTLSAAALFFTSCATISTSLPEPEPELVKSEARLQIKNALKLQHGHMMRLARVAKPILTENAELCPKVNPYYGLITHSAESYSKHIRDEAAAELGLGDEPVVLHVVPDSPAAKAGVTRGDIILSSKAIPISGTALRKIAVSDNGEQKLQLRRDGKTLNLTVQTVPGCDYGIGLRSSDLINAFATGRSITVTTGMMNFTETDEELAAILGHELAHNTMGHIRKIITNTVLSGFATRYTRPFESEADYVGLYYAARAGYDIENVENIWRRIGVRHPRGIGRAKSHPATPDRFLRLKAAKGEIDAKRQAGVPLYPNFKGKG
jgi:hypothetical protein